MNSEEFGRIVQEIGPLDDVIQGILQTSDGTFGVVVGETETLVGIDFLEDSQRYVIYSEVGRPSETEAFRVYEFLLTIASLWRETGGLSVSLDEPGGTLSLTYAGHVAALTPVILVRLVVNIALRAASLELAIRTGAAAVEETALATDLGETDHFLIRI